MNFGAIVAMDACLAVIRLRTFKVLPQFQRERRKDHSRLKRAIGHVQYDPLGPLWHSKAGRQWILSRADFEQKAMDEMYQEGKAILMLHAEGAYNNLNRYAL